MSHTTCRPFPRSFSSTFYLRDTWWVSDLDYFHFATHIPEKVKECKLLMEGIKDTWSFFGVLIDLIIGFLDLIMKDFDNQKQIFRELDLIIKPFDNQFFWDIWSIIGLCRLQTFTHKSRNPDWSHWVSSSVKTPIIISEDSFVVTSLLRLRKTLHRTSTQELICLLWIDKARVKDKTCIWVSVWWKTTN